jgi:hypothetical protein
LNSIIQHLLLPSTRNHQRVFIYLLEGIKKNYKVTKLNKIKPGETRNWGESRWNFCVLFFSFLICSPTYQTESSDGESLILQLNLHFFLSCPNGYNLWVDNYTLTRVNVSHHYNPGGGFISWRLCYKILAKICISTADTWPNKRVSIFLFSNSHVHAWSRVCLCKYINEFNVLMLFLYVLI